LAVVIEAEHGLEEEQAPTFPEKTALLILPQDSHPNPGQEIDQQLDHVILPGHEAAAASASGLSAADGAEGTQVQVGHGPGQLFFKDHRLGQHPGKRFVGCQLLSEIGMQPLRHSEPGVDTAAVKILHGKKRLRPHGGPLE